MIRSNKCFFGFVFAMAVLSINNVDAAHPFHVSNAEIEYNSKTKSFEIALCMWAEDIEAHFRAATNKPFDLDKIKNRDQLLADYIDERFTIADANRKVGRLNWVGHELEKRKVWVYFEIKIDSPHNYTIENRVLLDQHPQQVNLMQVRIGKSRNSFVATQAKAVFLQTKQLP